MYGQNSPLSWLLAPLQRWHLASPLHKALSVAAGAGVAYYTHTRKGWVPWKVAAAGVGTAYSTSLVLHTVKQYQIGAQGAPPALQGAQAPMMDGRPQYVPQQPAAPQAAPTPDNVVDIQARIKQAQDAYAAAQRDAKAAAAAAAAAPAAAPKSAEAPVAKAE